MTKPGLRDMGWQTPPTVAQTTARAFEGWALVGHGTWIYLTAPVTLAAIRLERELKAADHLPRRDPTFDRVLRVSGRADYGGWQLLHEQTRARQPLHPVTVREIDSLFDPDTGWFSKQPTRVRQGRWSGKYRSVPNKEGPSAPGRASRAGSIQ